MRSSGGRKVLTTLAAASTAALIGGSCPSASAQIDSLPISYSADPAVIPAHGATVVFTLAIGDVRVPFTIEAIDDSALGSVVDASNPNLLDTTCSAPTVVERTPGEPTGDYPCYYSALVPAGPEDLLHTITVRTVHEGRVTISRASVLLIMGEDRGATASGRVYEDVDGDQVFDPEEQGVPGVEFPIMGPVDRTAVSDDNGSYRFVGLPPGGYMVLPPRPPEGFGHAAWAWNFTVAEGETVVIPDVALTRVPEPPPTTVPPSVTHDVATEPVGDGELAPTDVLPSVTDDVAADGDELAFTGASIGLLLALSGFAIALGVVGLVWAKRITRVSRPLRR